MQAIKHNFDMKQRNFKFLDNVNGKAIGEIHLSKLYPARDTLQHAGSKSGGKWRDRRWEKHCQFSLSSPDVPLDFVPGNIRTLGKTRLTVSHGI